MIGYIVGEVIAGEVIAGSAISDVVLELILFSPLFFMIFIAHYVYTSFAFIAIARKKNLDSPGIALIPLVGPPLIANKIAKMHWWPFLCLAFLFIPLIGSIFVMVFSVFYIIWMWKTFESLDKPGWWALFIFIFPVYLVLLGIAAWGK